MKKLLVTLLFPVTCFTQTIPDTCFTEEQVIEISKTLDSLWEADSINNVLIEQHESVIKSYRNLIVLDSVQIAYQKQQIDLLNDNIDLYIKRQKQLQPKWYDSKGLWFGSGIVTVFLTAFSLSLIVN
jgi:hypothetical protein